jgi:hypothetical protein
MSQRQRSATLETIEELRDRIADLWGGEDCVRGPVPELGGWGFRSSGDNMRYICWEPGARAHLAEDNGRPYLSSPVPGGYVLVRCMDDAPDAWWWVDIPFCLGNDRVESALIGPNYKWYV